MDFVIPGQASRPIFVMGCPRSGTTVVSSALRSLGWRGFEEGHIFDVLTSAIRVVEGARTSYISDVVQTEWAMQALPLSTLEAGILRFFEDFMAGRFGRQWLDKTPGPDMIAIAPKLLDLFPHAKFVYCQRRGLDVIASATRRFGTSPESILAACGQWVDSVLRWREVAPLLGRSALLVEHSRLLAEPHAIAADMCELLEVDDVAKHEGLSSFLTENFPERTSQDFETLLFSKVDWSKEIQDAFIGRAGFAMALSGYGLETATATNGRSFPIRFSLDPKIVDLSQTGKADLYKYLGPDRFLLHPRDGGSSPTVVRYKDLDVGRYSYVVARASVENREAAEIACGLRLKSGDVVIGETIASCEWGRDAIMVLPVPDDHAVADVEVWSGMADEHATAAFAWCNIVGLSLVGR